MRRIWTRRRRSGALLAALAALIGVIAIAGPASAVHDLAFQLDGDVVAQTGGSQTVDWATLFNTDGSKKALPSGFTASTFAPDFRTNANGSFNTSDPTTYTTGSKDTLPISTGWQCTASNNVNSKVDIMNAYAAAYTQDNNGHQILYFALERNTNTGDGNVAFWFLQGSVGCDDHGGTASFTGDHHDGDLLMVSAFTNGGSVSNIDVYRWNGGANGSLGTTSVAHGVDCKSTSGLDAACATVNGPSNGTAGTITTPWSTANAKDGVGHSLRTSEFFEGGVDLTTANLGGRCFNTFTADTRSSQSLTATLFDYALGTLGECNSTTVTTPSTSPSLSSGHVTIPASGTLTTTDSAVLTASGVSSFSGTLTFSLCGPTAATSTATCDTGGTQIGTAQAVTANGTYPSSSATITSAGRYCWRADFSGDATLGVPGSSDHSAAECFTVDPRQPAISTQAGAGPVDFGSAVTDAATLSGTANRPGTGGVNGGSVDPTTPGGMAGGTITFTLYKDDCSTLATSTVAGETNPQAVGVSGDGSAYTASFTPDAPGTYHWVATYSGDSPNTLSASPSLACASDTAESVVVRQIPTSISTAQSAYPNDAATITSSVAGDNLPAGGTVVFSLYGATAGKTAAENCAAGSDTGRLYTETKTVGGQNSVTTGTSNTSVAVSTSGTYYWNVTYAPGDTAHTGRQSSCSENTVMTFTNDPGPGTVYSP